MVAMKLICFYFKKHHSYNRFRYFLPFHDVFKPAKPSVQTFCINFYDALFNLYVINNVIDT